MKLLENKERSWEEENQVFGLPFSHTREYTRLKLGPKFCIYCRVEVLKLGGRKSTVRAEILI